MTMDLWAFAVFALSSLFAVIDPLGCIPFFSGLTARMSRRRRRRVLGRALLVALAILLLFAGLGNTLLHLFGITLSAFRIAGGVIFFGIGLDMLQSRQRRWKTGIESAHSYDHPDEADEEDPSVTPLAIPLLAGPGSITTVMVLMAEAPGVPGRIVTLASVLVILLVSGLILVGGDAVMRRLGHTGLRVMEKLMGLMVTVIAVQLLLNGLEPFLRGLLRPAGAS
ncbi:MAG: MarC family protein [Candidatus Krumholzibacteriia bacterium]